MKGINMKNRTNNKKTKIVSFGDNQGVAFVNEIKWVNALQN